MKKSRKSAVSFEFLSPRANVPLSFFSPTWFGQARVVTCFKLKDTTLRNEYSIGDSSGDSAFGERRSRTARR